jgi:hypothetical protein
VSKENMDEKSKPLEFEDASAFEFVKEILAGDNTYAINFDRIQWDIELDGYVIVEFLLCAEKQFLFGVTPYTSHPNRYFNKNSMKFISLWKLTKHIGAKLYLINYSKLGTKFQDQVLLMDVIDINKESSPPVKTKDTQMTRKQFSDWFRELNKRGNK